MRKRITNEANDLAPKKSKNAFLLQQKLAVIMVKFCLKRENKDMIFGLNFDVTARKFQKFHGCCLKHKGRNLIIMLPKK